LAQSDIDKILEDIKKRKERSMAAAKARPPVEAPPAEEPVVQEQTQAAQVEPVAETPAISESDKQTLSDFINNSMDEKTEELDASYPRDDYISKKSEDYIDENFMKFFTQSVVVTKPPEETNNVQIKRKKGGFFKRKYITDSLSLNYESLEEEEEKKAKKRAKKEKLRDDMPIVKTAGDVWAESQRKAEQEELLRQAERTKPADKPDSQSAVQPVVEEQEAPVKVYKPKTSTSLNDILGDDKDPESLARRILRQRREKQAVAQSAVAVAVMEPETAAETEPDTTEISLQQEEQQAIVPAPAADDNSIISSIYTSVIERQAQEALAADEMTGFIPEFEEDEEEQAEDTDSVKIIPQEEEEEEPEVFEEYIVKSEFFDHPDDESEDIQSELITFRQTLSLRIVLGFACGAILTYFNMAARSGWPLPEFIAPAAQPMMFAIACMVIYAIAFVGFLPTVLSGFTSLKDSPAPDSFVSLGAVMAAVQLLFMIAFSAKTDMTKITIFGAFVCIALAFNAMGKKIATNTIIKNLTLANAPSGISTGYIVNDADAVKRLARTLDEKIPKILVSRKAGSITNFVNAGFSIHKSDYTARKVALVSYVVTIICTVMGYVLSKDIATAVFCGAGAAAMQMPLSRTLVNSVPSALMQKTLEKVGALVNGWQGMDQLAKTTHVNFDAKHLFPRGTVILHGIKTFEKERIDLAIIYAASVLIKECDVLRPVFMEVIEGKTDILYPVDSCEYIELQGYVSWINNNRIIIGNRTLMEKYDVDMPPVSMETRFTSQGRKPVYLAVGGKLFGMFVFSYRPDEIVKDNLAKLLEKGVSIILSSNDFNIDSALIETVYEVPRDYVSVLNQKEATLLAQFTAYSEESECCVAHLDSLSSLVAGFCGAESARSAENVCSLIQTLSVVIGAVLAVMFTYSQTIMHLPLTSILLISFGFMGLAMLTAVAKKYE